MNENEVWQQLTAVYREVFDDDDIAIRPETTAADIDEWDSLTNIQLLVAVERAFNGLKFNTGEVANLENVGEMAAIIVNRI
jgi:acyl carrier protein